ncbi:MAG: Hpt domain-containing protein [Burkholderiaceae bacterium]|nr:Hpt domain-containing protein [Burkholderiaceae bacterium]
MLSKFVQMYGPGLPELVAEATNAAALRQVAHSLRGASATIGATAVQGLAARLERLTAKADDPPALAEAARQLQLGLEALVQALQRRLA